VPAGGGDLDDAVAKPLEIGGAGAAVDIGIAIAATAPVRMALTRAMSGQHRQGRLDQPLERLHQPRPVGAVDGAVVEAACGAHDRGDLQAVVDHVRALLAGAIAMIMPWGGLMTAEKLEIPYIPMLERLAVPP